MDETFDLKQLSNFLSIIFWHGAIRICSTGIIAQLKSRQDTTCHSTEDLDESCFLEYLMENNIKGILEVNPISETLN